MEISDLNEEEKIKMEKELFNLQMEMFTKVNGKMEINQDMVNIFI